MQGGYAIAATIKDKGMTTDERIAACERYLARRFVRINCQAVRV